MAEITLGDLLRQDTVSNLDTGKASIEYIDLKLIDPDPRNFYKLSDLDELVQNIELLGLQQPLLVRTHPDKPDRVIVVSGHRRREALRRLVKEGHDEFKQVPCIRQRNTGSPAMQELCLIYANSATRTLTSGETAKQVDRTTFLLYELKNEGVEFPGKMRDHVAQACNVSASKVARINAIKSNLIPEYYELYLHDKLQESAAYTLSRFPADFQQRLLKAVPKLTSNSYADGLLRRYESGWRWEPSQQCPDGTQCKRGDAFLRHDAEVVSWEQCGGKKCCLTCEQMTRSYSTCERACSKAKAARKEKNDKKKAEEEKEQAKKMTTMLCDHCEGYKLCSSHFPGSPSCRSALQKHGWLPTYTIADHIRAMTDEELAAFLTEWASHPTAWRKEYGETKHWLKRTYPPREVPNA